MNTQIKLKKKTQKGSYTIKKAAAPQGWLNQGKQKTNQVCAYSVTDFP